MAIWRIKKETLPNGKVKETLVDVTKTQPEEQEPYDNWEHVPPTDMEIWVAKFIHALLYGHIQPADF